MCVDMNYYCTVELSQLTQEMEIHCKRKCTQLVNCQPHLLWSLGTGGEGRGKKMGGGGGGGGGALVVGSNIIIVQCIRKLVMILIHDMLITCSSWITTLGRLWAKCEQSVCMPLHNQSAIVLLFYEILNCYSGCYSVAYGHIPLSCN